VSERGRIPKSVIEAYRAGNWPGGEVLGVPVGHPFLLAIVGGRLMSDRWPAGVTVVMTSTLIEAVRAFPAALDQDQVAAVYELARRSTTWNPPPQRRLRRRRFQRRGTRRPEARGHARRDRSTAE
jgi:hypothetical protein